MVVATVGCRWDLAGLDAAMEQCVRAGGDAVVPRSMHFNQVLSALKKLGVQTKQTFSPHPSRVLSRATSACKVPR